MKWTQVVAVLVVMVTVLVQDTSGHFYTRRMFNRRQRMAGLYTGSRYRGYYGGFRPVLRTVFGTLLIRNRNDPDDRINLIDDDDDDQDVYIRLPSSVVNNPNFKLSNLPGYLSSGVFNPNTFPGVSTGSLPRPIVDPINPTGGFTSYGDDDLDSDLNSMFGGNNALGGVNTNLLGGPNTNLLGGAGNNFLGGTNTNFGGNTDFLGGGGSNFGAGSNTNLLTGAGNPANLGGSQLLI